MAIEKMEAPIVGKIIKCYVKVGDKVKEGDTICDLESMKMENPILTPVTGVVKEINVAPGKVVQAGDHIATIEY
ncbi:MAG: biotin/lipoyl-binding carrier protein [Dehalococcoidia bacterium]|nr:biotin/lipoyl-binding carrier protein [Dehalococcoidia bacterium]